MTVPVLYKDEEDLKRQLQKANQTISKQQEIIDDLIKQSMSEGMSLYGSYTPAVYWLGVVDVSKEEKKRSPCTDGLYTDNETKGDPLPTVDTSVPKEEEQVEQQQRQQDWETIAGEVLPSVHI